jgi:zinc transport system substrate-binding protein
VTPQNGIGNTGDALSDQASAEPQVIGQVQSALIERDNARRERDNAHHERDNACHERDDANHERDDTNHERDDANHERDVALRERDEAHHERDKTLRERDEALHEKKLAIKDWDAAYTTNHSSYDAIRNQLDTASENISAYQETVLLLKDEIKKWQSSCKELQLENRD